MDYKAIREDYETDGFDPAALGDDPLQAVSVWLEAAIAADVPQANAINLATVSETGEPSVRTVLLKGIDTGLVFYTNYESWKGVDMAHTPRAAMSVTWVQIHQQIRAEGTIEKVSTEMSDAYFSSRPHGARIAAAASTQSQPMGDRTELVARTNGLMEQYPEHIARPAHWGGYRLIPDRVEFWQGRRSRMHDRFQFTRNGGGWDTTRLWP